jgi:hypothetical protein
MVSFPRVSSYLLEDPNEASHFNGHHCKLPAVDHVFDPCVCHLCPCIGDLQTTLPSARELPWTKNSSGNFVVSGSPLH